MATVIDNAELVATYKELMAANKDELDSQFTAGRLTGADYANVYMSGMQAAMSTATQFVLSRQSSYQQTELLEEQTELAIKQQANMEAQTKVTLERGGFR